MTALGTRSLVLTVGGTDYTDQIFNTEIRSRAADSSDTTFKEASEGGAKIWSLHGVITQDLAVGTMWDKIWSSPGTTVAAIVKPYGNAAASATQPHYSGNVTITVPDGVLIGGDADKGAGRNKVEIEWDFTAKPTKITA